jgi:SAM-dependent methyltransferase
MKLAAAPRFFDAIAERYDRVYAPPAIESRLRMSRVLAALPRGPLRILDLGVGTGRELASLLDAGHEPTGLDASSAMLERCARRGRPTALVRADFWRAPLPFAPNAFDAAIALHGTLAHPPDPLALGRLAAELARVVCPSGWLVAEVATPAWLDAIEVVDAGQEPNGRAIRRTGPRACVLEDRVVGLAIEARLLDASEWTKALLPAWRPQVRPVSESEWLLVAQRV